MNSEQVLNALVLVLDRAREHDDRVERFDLKSDGLASQHAREDLHDSTHDEVSMSAKAIPSCTKQ